MTTLSVSQQAALDKIFDFIEGVNDNERPRIFILKGYAGTGKTTLIHSMLKRLITTHRSVPTHSMAHYLLYKLMAPTGRAAKVLRDKINGCNAATIHRSIFNFNIETIDGREPDMSGDDYHLVFPLIVGEQVDYIIVDESSMVSDAIDNNNFMMFGSGHLLSDLLAYAEMSHTKAIIFVGDSAQLPPVTDAVSHALDTQYFAERGYRVDSTELTEVFRQKEGGILDVATHIRTLLGKPRDERHSLNFDYGDGIESLSLADVPDRYVSEFPYRDLKDGVVVCYNNRLCQETNMLIRRQMYGADADMQVGDLLLVNNNSYGMGVIIADDEKDDNKGYSIKGHCDFYNGDMIKITAIGLQEIRKHVPVTFDGIKSHVDLVFRHLEVQLENGNKARCIILENLLNSPNRDITEVERRALYVDFCIRMREVGIKKEDKKCYLRNDAFFNALRVKYGYAITCHKAQGGEWNEVIVNFTGMCRLDDEALRWCYTAVTRAKDKLLTVNSPNITQYSKMRFSGIELISKLSGTFFDPAITVETPFHANGGMVAVKLKCRGVMTALEGTFLAIQSIEHFNWRERYYFIDNDSGKVYVIDALYKGSGVFANSVPKTADPVEKYLCDMFNASFDWSFECSYAPSNDIMQEHYELMRSMCVETGITITNVEEHLDKYYVTYCLATSAFATMQFYMQGNSFSTVMPKSTAGNDDEKLKQLISKLQ